MQSSVPNYRIYGDFDTDFALNPVHIDDVKRSTAQNNWLIEPHRHDDLCHLVYFFSGGGSMQLQGVDYTLKAPCFCIIPVGSVHSFNVEENIEGTLITVARDYLDKVLAGSEPCLALLDLPCYIEGKDHAEFFEQITPLFRQLRTQYTERQPARGLSIQCLLGLIFSNIAGLALPRTIENQEHVVEDKNLWYYRQFQNQIGYSVAQKKSVSEYAAELRISATHLNRICQSVANKSALTVIHDRIISEAKVNLAYTFQSVSEVAYRLGFEDLSYFSRFFKKHTGIAPKIFKEKVRRQHQPQGDAGTAG